MLLVFLFVYLFANFDCLSVFVLLLFIFSLFFLLVVFVCLILLVCHFGYLLVHDRDLNVILGS